LKTINFHQEFEDTLY